MKEIRNPTIYPDYFDISYDNPTNIQMDFERKEVERILMQNKVNKASNLSKLQKIVSEPFAECLKGERISGIEIKRRIKLLKENGYKVRPGFWEMKSNQVWRYYQSLKHDILKQN